MAASKKQDRKIGNDMLGRARRQALRDRLRVIRYYNIKDDSEDPPKVAAARKIVEAHDLRAKNLLEKKREDAIKLKEEAEFAILATDSFDEGLRIVESALAAARKLGVDC